MDTVANILASSGEELQRNFSNKQYSIYSLKKLKDSQLIPYINKGNESFVRYISFYLIIFLNDVFYNLAGDLPYEETAHKIKNDFFYEIGGKLLILGSALNQKDFSLVQAELVNLNNLYLDTIESVNEILDKRFGYDN